MKILNVAAGKIKPILRDVVEPYFLLNLDTSYFSADGAATIERNADAWDEYENDTFECFCDTDAFTFMERTRLLFNVVTVYRFLEHVPFDRLLYFIYLLSTVTKKGGVVDIIVPNYEILARLLLEEDVNSPQFEADNIVLTTEIVNEPGCPHASIWTPARAFKFFEMEKRFSIDQMIPEFEFDGRAIYMRFKAKRI